MKFAFAFAPAAAMVFALAMTPALAAEQHQRRPQSHWNGPDPSFGNRADIGQARSYNRCVEDLGYGRYEYCD